MAEMDMGLKDFKFEMEKNLFQLKTYNDKSTFCVSALYVKNLSKKGEGYCGTFQDLNGYNYFFIVCLRKSEVEITIRSVDDPPILDQSDWEFSVHTDSRIIPICHNVAKRKELMRNVGRVCWASIGLYGYPYLPHDIPCVFICKKTLPKVENPILTNISSSSLAESFSYLKSLDADLKEWPSAVLKEKVILRVDEEIEIVNKAILCARSPVFAKMFGSDAEDNNVIITDIKMPVLRSLVSFLSSGILSYSDFDFLWDLYSAALKYDIRELYQACMKALLTKITFENILDVLKLSFSQNDELLKCALMTLVSANIETVAVTSEWRKLMCDDPDIALKSSAFLDSKKDYA